MTSPTIEEYDLYLDESGDFMETSTNPRERARSRSRKDKAPSQLGALLVPREDINQSTKAILQAAKTKARLPSNEPIHARDIPYGYQYLTMADVIIKGVQRQTSWQPVRLVNREKVTYGDRVSTYTNLVAELIFRVFEEKSRARPESQTALRVFAATWVFLNPDDENDPVQHTLRAPEYEKRIREYLGFASVRHGAAKIQRNWMFQGLEIRSPREIEALQISDVLSNASHKDFNRLATQPRLARVLKRLLGEYDFTLTIRELFERVDELVKEYSFGMALMILAEALVHAPHATKQDLEFAAKLQERLDHIIERLGRMDFRGRDPQLAVLIGWLDQLVGQQRLLDKGIEITHWLLGHVEAPLRKRLAGQKDEATLNWFAYSLRRWALTACNHKGVLLQGQADMEAMRSLQPSVAKQWERIPLVMDGLIAQAVHYTDCFEFDKASKRMRFVADSLKMQSNRFHELMPADFPERLRFDLRARALGTFVQSEIFAGATDPARLQLARRASEEAVAEFDSFSDRARQYQYRCHLETVAKDFETARKYLVKSLEGTDTEPTDYSHSKVADLIRDFSIDPEWKAEFALVHWLRIGASACLDAHQATDSRLEAEPVAGGDQVDAQSGQAAIESERDQFLDAIDRSELLDSDACSGKLPDYPAHSILHFVAVINAARGKWDDSLTALQRLHALDPIGKEQFVLAMILIAAQTEVAALFWEYDESKSRALLANDDLPFLGLKEMTKQIEETPQFRLPAIAALTRRWLGMVIHLIENQPQALNAKKALLELSGTNVY